MNRSDRERLVVLSRVKDKAVSRVEAAEILGLSLRQVHRLYLRFKAKGDIGLIHLSRGRASPRRIVPADRERALGWYREHYAGADGYGGFGPTLFAQKLGTVHGLYVSHDTARRWMIGWGLLTDDLSRRRRSRRRRVRRSRLGSMIQMDGSHHDWFEGRGKRCVLMVMVDDATGRKLVRFYPGETVAAAMDMMGRWCKLHGVPSSLYVDRAGIYRCERDATVTEMRSKVKPVTQFGRAMKELDVRLILARSPQAKGRVERANGTLQDRLVKELRLAKISSMESANAWLESGGFIEDLNQRQALAPADPADMHRPLVLKLEDVLCLKEKRTVGHDGCVQWCGKVLQLGSIKGHARPRAVEIWSNVCTETMASVRSGALIWPWEELTSRPVKAVVVPMRSGSGVAHKPTAKMRRQISDLFKRRETGPGVRL